MQMIKYRKTRASASQVFEHCLLTELSADKLTSLNQISAYFEDLKRYIRNYDIEAALAKGLLERLNLIMISQNRIQDHLYRSI